MVLSSPENQSVSPIPLRKFRIAELSLATMKSPSTEVAWCAPGCGTRASTVVSPGQALSELPDTVADPALHPQNSADVPMFRTKARASGGDVFAAIEAVLPWPNLESTVAEAQTLA